MASPRKTDFLLDTHIGYGRQTHTGAVKISQAGSVNFAAAITNIAGNTPYVGRPLRCSIMNYPRGFNYLPNALDMREALRQMIEISAHRISGISSGLTPETAQVDAGNSGEKYTVYTGMTREISTPEFEWPELNGFVVSRYWEYYYRMLIADENTKRPGVVALSNGPKAASEWDNTFHSFDVLFWEADPLGLEPTKAWLCAGMSPTSSVPVEGNFEIGRIGETKTVTMAFNAVTEVGLGVMQMAQNEINRMKREGVSTSELKTLHTGMSEDVKATNVGLQIDQERAATRRIK